MSLTLIVIVVVAGGIVTCSELEDPTVWITADIASVVVITKSVDAVVTGSEIAVVVCAVDSSGSNKLFGAMVVSTFSTKGV